MNVLMDVGVDVSKAQLDVACGSSGKPFSVANDRAGITQLLEQVAQQGECCLVVEGSGGYERLLVAEALQHNARMALVNPRRVRALAESRGLAKTDPLDAAVIAKFGEVNREEIAALGGLAPFHNDSGTHTGKRSIRGGRAPLRTALDMAALSAMRCNPQLKKFAHRLQQTGQPAKVVITAVMRKLLTLMNAILKTKRPWRGTTPAAVPAT